MKELATALLKARRQCGATVFKAGHNRAQDYSYAGHLQVLTGGARAALLDNGLSLIQVGVSFIGAETTGKNPCWRWRGSFVLVHESGETIELTYEATTNTTDKSAFVASTALDRTAHMRVLELAGSDQENPEHDSNDDGPRSQQRVPVLSVMEEMLEDLAGRKNRAQMAQWVRDMDAINASQDAKRPAWHAYGKACHALGLDPREVAAEARGKAA